MCAQAAVLLPRAAGLTLGGGMLGALAITTLVLPLVNAATRHEAIRHE
ncbi:hypothetical protein ACIBEJ_24435 [Nonomuraea sp. NPDC050790]